MTTTQEQASASKSEVESAEQTGKLSFESFRQQVKAIIANICRKVSDDNLRVSYNWSMGRVFNECGEQCLKISAGKALPVEFKTLVRFEFNKLKDSVTSGDGWTHDRSRFGEKLVDGGVAKVRVDTFSNEFIALNEQLELARKIYSAVERQLVSATAEKAVGLKKRAKKAQVVIDYLVAEIARQEAVKAEVAAMVADSNKAE